MVRPLVWTAVAALGAAAAVAAVFLQWDTPAHTLAPDTLSFTATAATTSSDITVVAAPARSLVAAESSTAPGPAATGTPVRYRVREGDTLTAVARFYGVRIDDLVRVNRLPASDLIVPGLELIIPLDP